jgi:hypothetical protein
MKTLHAVSLLTLFALAAAPGKASVLGLWSYSFGGGASAEDSPVRGVLAIAPETVLTCPITSDCSVFFDQSLTDSVIGSSFTLDSNSTNFAQVASLFTDNVADYVWELGYDSHGAGGGNANTEKNRFALGGVDFSGDTVTSIVTTITSGTYIAGNNYKVFGARTEVLGTQGGSPVPEPVSSALVLSGVCFLGGFGLRRHIRSRQG